MIDVINARRDISFDIVDARQRVQICFNILPKGRGILHKLAIGQSGNTNDQVEAFESTKYVFAEINNPNNFRITGVDECSFEFPILPDVYGKTALDYCLGIIDIPESSSIFLHKKKINMDKLHDSENKPMAEFIFT